MTLGFDLLPDLGLASIPTIATQETLFANESNLLICDHNTTRTLCWRWITPRNVRGYPSLSIFGEPKSFYNLSTNADYPLSQPHRYPLPNPLSFLPIWAKGKGNSQTPRYQTDTSARLRSLVWSILLWLSFSFPGLQLPATFANCNLDKGSNGCMRVFGQ